MSLKTKIILIALIFVQCQSLIELQLDPKVSPQVCSILMRSFDPINVQLKFPKLDVQIEKENFGIRLIRLTDFQQQISVEVSDNYIYRNTFQLEQNIPYELCISFNSQNDPDMQKPIYIGYSATQSFQKNIGAIQVPEELANEENLKKMYEIANKLKNVASVISSHQAKERKIEDDLVTKDIHKQKRILLLGLIQCLVILLSGVYQILALRKFLIQKNLF